MSEARSPGCNTYLNSASAASLTRRVESEPRRWSYSQNAMAPDCIRVSQVHRDWQASAEHSESMRMSVTKLSCPCAVPGRAESCDENGGQGSGTVTQ